jgi:hypothetical protein
MDTTIPTVPLNLVEYLEARQLQKAPDAETATEPELRVYAAEMRFVRQLRGIYNDQTNPSEDLP